MPKLKPVTNEELTEVIRAGQSYAQDADVIAKRLRSSISASGPTAPPAAAALAAMSIAVAFAELASALASRAALAELKITTREELERR